MSMYEPQARAHFEDPRTAGAPQRPANLTRAVYAAIATATLNVISAIGIIVSGTDAIKEQIAANSNMGSAPISPDEVDVQSDRFESLQMIYSGLAYSTIFWSLVLVLLAWLALRGGGAVRIFATIIVIVSVLFKAVSPFITLPTLTLVADALVAVLGLAAAIFFFGAGGKAARQGR
ncbi:hypothetical protein [Nonomuraea jabiensis]|uniref:Uncharacterized protein n=1 Tax=Nonomuraea jabiensis TaxID=882448 RepID=A0A7W9G5B1_9ACTN|nr:hypothetical protein [Nonomuraea jabiensis]MBB5777557.1 hypothetical protein [Nonomuraea jabiensis]